MTCVHVGAFPPTHNWAKILENCQAKKRPRLIQTRLGISHAWALLSTRLVTNESRCLSLTICLLARYWQVKGTNSFVRSTIIQVFQLLVATNLSNQLTACQVLVSQRHSFVRNGKSPPMAKKTV